MEVVEICCRLEQHLTYPLLLYGKPTASCKRWLQATTPQSCRAGTAARAACSSRFPDLSSNHILRGIKRSAEVSKGVTGGVDITLCCNGGVDITLVVQTPAGRHGTKHWEVVRLVRMSELVGCDRRAPGTYAKLTCACSAALYNPQARVLTLCRFWQTASRRISHSMLAK